MEHKISNFYDSIGCIVKCASCVQLVSGDRAGDFILPRAMLVFS
jgi:hypothetical protein